MASFYHDGYGDRKNRGEQTLRMEKTGTQNIMPSGFSYNISSLKVDPGYELCIYQRPYLQTSEPGNIVPYCTGETRMDELWKVKMGSRWNWDNNIASFTLKKDCNHPKFMWDKDCIYADKEHTTGKCSDKQSQCHRNRVIHCNLSEDPSHECLHFCNENHGSCDLVMKKFCALPYNKDKDECSCINSPGSKFGPSCFDNKCVNLGYQTKKMMEEECPDETDCGVYNSLQGQVDFTDGTIDGRCKSKTKTNAPKITPKVPNPEIQVTPVTQMKIQPSSNSNSNGSSVWMYVLIVIIIVLMILVAYILLRGRAPATVPLKLKSAFNMTVAPLLKRIR